MEFQELIDGLLKESAYPDPVAKVEVIQTHISVVALAGSFVYKIRKPVNLGFLDFSTLEKRKHDCEEEVRLNRRLAPTVYLGVVPITKDENGLHVEGNGEPVEWAVKMERLPEEASLAERLKTGETDQNILNTLAERIAKFHLHADGGPRIVEFGRFEVVAGNVRENFEQARAHIDQTFTRAVFDRLERLMEEEMVRNRQLIEARAARGVPRDTHGDLRLDHVYHFPDRQPPNDLVVIDCIEFNERFRYADPVSDTAFMRMDLLYQGHRTLADVFCNTYFRQTGDREGESLLNLYTAYRAIVRAKVEGMELAEKETPEGKRDAVRVRSGAHWLLALGVLEKPSRKPCLVLVGGLPGSGKSTLAQGLAETAGFDVIRSDVVRKELAGLKPGDSARSSHNEGIYSPESTEKTYAECLARAEHRLQKGGRVIIDASFGSERHRKRFLDAAVRNGAQGLFLVCIASPEVARRRLQDRRGDASDADLNTYDRSARTWSAVSEGKQFACDIDTSGAKEAGLAAAARELERRALTE
jgi:aminoglycoside phosphotransferase family enzyme/predicted kinase